MTSQAGAALQCLGHQRTATTRALLSRKQMPVWVKPAVGRGVPLQPQWMQGRAIPCLAPRRGHEWAFGQAFGVVEQKSPLAMARNEASEGPLVERGASGRG